MVFEINIGGAKAILENNFQNSKMISRKYFLQYKFNFQKFFSGNMFRKTFSENQICIPKNIFHNESKFWKKFKFHKTFFEFLLKK